MNAQQAENLRILIRHMENNVSRKLDMGFYFNPCGTPACALGEACTIPALLARGLRVIKNHSGTPFMPELEEEVFGLDDDDLRLFGLPRDNAWGRADVAPQEWAAEARKVLVENGYSMGPDNPPVMDAFARFKSRVLEPVEL